MHSDQHTITTNWIMSAFSVFLIPPIVFGIAIVPIAKEFGLSDTTKAKLLHCGLLLGFLSMLIYSAVSLRRMLSRDWPARAAYFAIVAAIAAACGAAAEVP